MWAHVQQQLAQRFSERLYPTLFCDRYYRQFLGKAGLGPNFPRDLRSLSALQLKDLQNQATIEAHLTTGALMRAQSLNEATAQGRILNGPLRLYRLWDGDHSTSKIGIWWFTEDVLRRCRQAAGPKQPDRFEWLRSFLAVSLDWSNCDRLARLELRSGDELPVVQAVGLPVRQYSTSAWKSPKVPMPDYWKKINSYFPGGIIQTVLPWIPDDRVQGLPHI